MLKRNIAIIFDDHRLFADSFSTFVDRLGVYDRVISFNDEKELNHFLVKNNDAQLHLFVDYYLGSSTSLMLISYVRKIVKKIKVVCVTSCINPSDINLVLRHGVDGFINKTSDASILSLCINALERNQQYLCPFTQEIINRCIDNTTIQFTPREIELLRYFDQGLSIIETAEKINLSKHTVVSHRRNMMAKTKTNSIIELLAHARSMGLL